MVEQRTTELIGLLVEAGVDFVIIGGAAAYAHGSSYVTEDLDIAAPFCDENISKLLGAIEPLSPKHALTPGPRPVTEPAHEIATWKNVYFLTDAGRLDVLGEIPPVDDYDALRSDAESITLDGAPCRLASIEHLIAMKSALGRPKDLLVVEQLRAILERRDARH